MKAFLLTRIRFRIMGIVLLAIIPAVALIWYSAADRQRQTSAEIEGNTLRLSRFLASNLERDLSGGEGYLNSLLETLGAKSLLAGGCSDALATLMDGPTVYANLGLAGPDGKILCSGKPASSIVGLGALEWFHKLDSANGFSVGFDFNGGLSAEPSIVLVQPVPAGRARAPEKRYLFAVMQLGWLNQLAENSRLPPGSAVSVTNRNGDAVARYPDPDKWVGKARRPVKELENPDAPEGTRVKNGLDGVKRLYAYAKVPGKGNLIVNVGVDRDAIMAPANAALWNQLIALGVVALLAMLAAWFGTDVFLLQQVRTLIAATKQLGSGNLGARSGLPYEGGELGELAKAFDEMAETLEWRNAQLRESEFERTDALAKISEIVDCVPEPFFVLDETFAIRALNAEGSALLGTGKEELAGKGIQGYCPGFPSIETSWLAAGETRPPGPQVRRFRAQIKPVRGSPKPVPVDISLTRISIAHHPYFLALFKRALEPIPDL
jgi:PAS domain-containing protein